MKKKVIVLVPIYKENPSPYEKASFRQCLRILNKHEISLITYRSLNLDAYKAISEIENKSFGIVYYSQSYFESVKGYNQLLLSMSFYNDFRNYEYILIYQLDAMVFRDELVYWCNKGYDWIGSPVFSSDGNGGYTENVRGIGNGGFNLRKVDYCVRVLNMNKHLPFLNIKGLLDRRDLHWYSYLAIPIKLLGFQNTFSYFIKKGINEDLLYSVYMNNSYHKIKLPLFEEALKFSFEIRPSYFYKELGHYLPFGCHAFEKFEFDTFWKKVFKEQKII